MSTEWWVYVGRMSRVRGKTHLKCSGNENGLQISVQTIQLQLQKGKRKRKERPFLENVWVLQLIV